MAPPLAPAPEAAPEPEPVPEAALAPEVAALAVVLAGMYRYVFPGWCDRLRMCWWGSSLGSVEAAAAGCGGGGARRRRCSRDQRGRGVAEGFLRREEVRFRSVTGVWSARK